MSDVLTTIKALALATFTVLAPVHAMMVSVGVLIVADLATGIWAAKKRGEQIKSARIRDSITKMVIFQVAVITAFVMENFLLEGTIPVTKIVAAAIAFSEGKSLFENINTITGKDVFGMLIDKLGSKNKEEKK